MTFNVPSDWRNRVGRAKGSRPSRLSPNPSNQGSALCRHRSFSYPPLLQFLSSVVIAKLKGHTVQRRSRRIWQTTLLRCDTLQTILVYGEKNKGLIMMMTMMMIRPELGTKTWDKTKNSGNKMKNQRDGHSAVLVRLPCSFVLFAPFFVFKDADPTMPSF